MVPSEVTSTWPHASRATPWAARFWFRKPPSPRRAPTSSVGEELSIRAKGFQEAILAYDLKGIGGAAPLFLDRREAASGLPSSAACQTHAPRREALHVDEADRRPRRNLGTHATISGTSPSPPRKHSPARAARQRAGTFGRGLREGAPTHSRGVGDDVAAVHRRPSEILAIVQARATAPHSR